MPTSELDKKIIEENAKKLVEIIKSGDPEGLLVDDPKIYERIKIKLIMILS